VGGRGFKTHGVNLIFIFFISIVMLCLNIIKYVNVNNTLIT
jgi:hypothetical protein